MRVDVVRNEWHVVRTVRRAKVEDAPAMLTRDRGKNLFPALYPTLVVSAVPAGLE